MAPQNSTLIHGQFAESSPELVLSRYSPILPRAVHSDQSHRSTSVAGSVDQRSIFTDHEENQWNLEHDGSDVGSEDDPNNDVEEEIPIWIGKDDVRYVSGVTAITTCNDVIAILIQDELDSKNYSNIEGLRHDIDDYIIVEKWRDVEAKLDGQTKILPLYQAWGALQSEVRFRLKINKNKRMAKVEQIVEKNGGHKKDKVNLLTKMVKRVLKQGDYIQKHINVLKDKRERPSPVIKYNAKTNKILNKNFFYETCKPNNSMQSLASSKCSSVERLYCKCCHNLTIKNKGFEVRKLAYNKNNLLRPSPPPAPYVAAPEDIKTDDELLLILDEPEPELDNPSSGSNETLKASDSGNASGLSFHEIVDLNELGKSMNVDETPCAKMQKELNNTQNKKPHRLIRSQSYKKSMASDSECSSITSSSNNDPITATPKRKVRSMRAYDILRQHSVNKKLLESLSHLNLSELPTPSVIHHHARPRNDQFDSIRFEIMMKMSEMKQLLLREEMLLTQIQLKCAHYKAENEAYNSRVELDLHVEEIQKNLEECAHEIIRNEQELFKTKLEVERKAKVLQDLKDLLNIETSEEERAMIRFKERTKNQMEKVKYRMSLDELNFVDDIYEHCDGNKSMIV